MKRVIFLLVLLVGLSSIAYHAVVQDLKTPTGLEFETLFRVLGHPIKTVDRGITRVMGVTAKDERELGQIIAKELESHHQAYRTKETEYLNQLIQQLAQQFNPKNLEYRVFILSGAPNAFATAGGNIVVTSGLLHILKTEAQLVSILGHEKGHIDLGHCIDHMRFQAKSHDKSSGRFIDWYLSSLTRHGFSKFQENESDRFGFETLISLQYDPSALSQSFSLMLKHFGQRKHKGLNPVADYLATHPSLSIRAENWENKASRWKKLNPSSKYYQGRQNFINRQSRSQKDLENEWHPK